MAAIKKGDFIEVEYTGKVVEDNFIFDTTSEKVAKEQHIYNQHAQYGPVTVCVGEQQMLPGLDANIQGKEIGKEYVMHLSPEDGFGKKSAQLLKLIPASAFKKGNTRPEIGMHVEVDGQPGLIKTVTGGRVVVDFNHPLSGKELEYSVKATRLITDDAEKITAIISNVLSLKKEHIEVTVSGGKATVKTMKLPEMFHKEFSTRITTLVPTIKEVVFEEKELKKVEKKV